MTRLPGDVGESRGSDSDIEGRGGTSGLNCGLQALKLQACMRSYATSFAVTCDGIRGSD